MENLPKNIKDLLSSIEPKNNCGGDVSSPEKENSLPEKEIAELKIEGLIESRAQDKNTIPELEKIIKKYPEFTEKIKTELTDTISKAGKKYDEAVAKDKLENNHEERTVIENESKKQINALRNEFLALKSIRDHFFKKAPEINKDKDKE